MPQPSKIDSCRFSQRPAALAGAPSESVEDRLMPIFSMTGRPCGRPVNQ
jgi:hypothetical protein